jgi:tyrosinase
MVGGHIGSPNFAAFDPLFWLHHANVDRFVTIFSAINPSSYVLPQANNLGTYAEAPGTIEDVNTPLLPFHNESYTSFHTSATVSDIKIFGYSYPEIVDWGISSDDLAFNVRKTFKELYNPAERPGSLNNTRVTPRTQVDVQKIWFINVKAERNLSNSIIIYFFIGNPPPQPIEWSTASNLITSQVLLPKPFVDHFTLAQIPLTRSIRYADEAGRLNGTNVEAYLKENLYWNISSASYNPIQFSGIEITIVD